MNGICIVCSEYYFDHKTPCLRFSRTKTGKIKKRQSLPIRLKRQVKKRSGNKCEDCGQDAKTIHHLLSVSRYPEKQHELTNLIHLCIKCHRLRHPDLPEILFKQIPI